MKTVGVKHFNIDGTVNEHLYHFKCGINVDVGNTVLCATAGGGLALGKIEVIDVEYPRATKNVICKVDLSEYYRSLETEIKLKEIKTKMDERRKKLEEFEIYTLLASKDEEMAKLLEEYKDLQK